MTVEQILKFIGEIVAVGGGAAALAYALFVWLGKKWLEERFAQRLEAYKHTQNRELEHYKYQINALFNRITKIHEREIEVLPTAWQKLQDALGYVADFTAPVQYHPEFNRMNEQEINEFLENSILSDSDKQKLLEVPDKEQYYEKIIFPYRLNKVKEHVGGFHNYILHNSIFLSPDLHAQFKAMDKLLWDALHYRELGKASRDYKLTIKAWEEIQEKADPLREEIERLVQKRLRLEEAE